jgi:hypothetical protein
MKVRAVRVSAFVFAALPPQYRTHNLSVVDNVFNTLISALSTFPNLLHQRISFLRMRVEVGVYI